MLSAFVRSFITKPDSKEDDDNRAKNIDSINNKKEVEPDSILVDDDKVAKTRTHNNCDKNIHSNGEAPNDINKNDIESDVKKVDSSVDDTIVDYITKKNVACDSEKVNDCGGNEDTTKVILAFNKLKEYDELFKKFFCFYECIVEYEVMEDFIDDKYRTVSSSFRNMFGNKDIKDSDECIYYYFKAYYMQQFIHIPYNIKKQMKHHEYYKATKQFRNYLIRNNQKSFDHTDIIFKDHNQMKNGKYKFVLGKYQNFIDCVWINNPIVY